MAGVAQAGPQTATGMNQNLNRNANRGGQRQNQNQNQGDNQPTRTVRPRLVVAFSTPIASGSAMTARLSTRMQKIQKAGFEGVTVEVDGRTAILRGEVASEEARRMAKLIVKLEPGIRTVQNELVVVSPEPLPVE
jgi:hypothetical protein